MVRNLRLLGLALAAVFALTAVAASAAMAEEFHSEKETTTLLGKQTETHKFVTSVGTVTCEVAEFKGTVTGTKKAENDFANPEVTIHPTYEKCKLSGININVTVTTTGCNYRFYNVATKSGPVDVVCETGKEITVAGTGCTVKVPGQTGLKTVEYANEGTGTGRTVKVTAKVTGIKYTTSGFLCGTSSKENGEYSGPTKVEGVGPVGIWVE